MNPAELANHAQELKRHGQAAKALEILIPALKQEPANPLLHHFAGNLQLQLEQFEDAINHLKQACQLNPIPDALSDLASVYLTCNRVLDALLTMQRIQADPISNRIQTIWTEIETRYSQALSHQPALASDTQYRYSIIIPHYDRSIGDELLIRTLQSIDAQTEGRFEVLLYHDGHLSRPLPDLSWVRFPLRILISPKRYNDWGHSLRHQGIHAATGDYIVHMNADNILYPNALEEIERLSQPDAYPTAVSSSGERWHIEPEIIIFPIYQMGWACDGKGLRRFDTGQQVYRVIMTGYPPVRGFIDAMQLVMTREKWLEYGGWSNRAADSDGIMYERFVLENGARYSDKILGEHW